MAASANVSSSTTIGSRSEATIASRSASSTSFAADACSPPSIQPAPCMRKFTPPMTAPHSEKTLS